MLYENDRAEGQYQELSLYISRTASRIARETIPSSTDAHQEKRLALEQKIRNIITEVRMLDREISLDAQEYWKKLPVIDG